MTADAASFTSSSDERFQIGEVISKTFVALRKRLPFLLLLAAICVFVPAVISGVINYKFNAAMGTINFPWDAFSYHVNPAGLINWNWFLSFLLVVSGNLFLEAAVVGTVVSDFEDRSAPLLLSAWRHILPLFGIFVSVYVFCVISGVLLIIPAIILLLMFSVAGPVRVAEGRGVFGSIQRSRELTRGFRWKILLLVILYYVGVAVVDAIVGAVKMLIHVPNEIWAISVGPAIGAMLILVGTVGLAVTYAGLRSAKEGGSASDVAAAFA
jgi:hypothetical protein